MHLVLSFALAWEVVYHVAKHACKRRFAGWPKARTLGGSYVTAFLNALVCSAAGAWVVACLFDATIHERALPVAADGPSHSAGVVAYLAGTSFSGWLISDLVHLATHFPALGGADMVLHHVGFAAVALMGAGFRYCPWVVGWLMLGEVSSIFLNLRWGLINTGRGETRALQRTNAAFAMSFFVCRVVVFWLGLYEFWMRERPHLLAPPQDAPPWCVNALGVALACGALLNAWWMHKILQMAARPPKSISELHSLRREHSSEGLQQPDAELAPV